MAKILLVEDNRTLRNYLRAFLEEDYIVETAVNGQEGLVKMSSFHPDLLLTDIDMPILNGLELITAIIDPHTGKLPCIVIAISGDDVDRKNLRDADSLGVHATFEKPIHLAELNEKIQVLLS